MLLLTAGAHAQLYKSVGPDGRVTYSDAPPPAGASRVATSRSQGDAATGLPYELAQAARAHPVVLYTAADCAACDDGRRLLVERGIPFSEKTIRTAEDQERYRKIAGGMQVPLLSVGRSQERGYEPGSWNAALTAAGYPETSRLPRSYRRPAAEALAPKMAPAPATAGGPSQEATPPTDLPPAAGNAPPGFRF